MRIARVTTIVAANEFLPNFLENQWRKKFVVSALDPTIGYRPLEGFQDPKQVCSVKIQREIRQDSAISFENVLYVLSAKQGEPLLAARVAEVRIYPNNTWSVYAEGRRLNLNLAPSNRQPDPKFRHKIRVGNPDLSMEYAPRRKAA